MLKIKRYCQRLLGLLVWKNLYHDLSCPLDFFFNLFLFLSNILLTLRKIGKIINNDGASLLHYGMIKICRMMGWGCGGPRGGWGRGRGVSSEHSHPRLSLSFNARKSEGVPKMQRKNQSPSLCLFPLQFIAINLPDLGFLHTCRTWSLYNS